MPKPTRSPMLGYNHNVKYRGRIFHVQTEDSGPANPHLFTHLYFQGTILASKRHQYDRESSDEVVRGLMQGQHKGILKELKQARFDEKLEAFFQSRGEPLVPDDQLAEVTAEAAEIEEAPALDLDSLPATEIDTPAPEPALARAPHAPSPGGPGVYTIKGNTRETVRRASPAAAPPVTPTPAVQPIIPEMPLVVFEPDDAVTPGPSMPFASSATPPPRPAPGMTPPPPPRAVGVAVQRQVVVGVGSGPRPSSTARPRRPAQAIPYVVKEGSHPSALSMGRSQAVPPPTPRAATTVSPPRQMVPTAATSANAPLTSGIGVTPAPLPPSDAISDKSLDEVILTYLAQGDSGDGSH